MAPIFVLNRYLDVSQLSGEPGARWTEVVCDSKKAYGCGENIQEAVKGLKLYVRLGDDPLITSSLTIRMTDDALRRFDSELELGFRPLDPGFRQPETTAEGCILMDAEEDLMIIMLNLHRQFYGNLVYQLVYDYRHASLSMIKPVQAQAGLNPVPKRTSDGDYELFLMASESRECGLPSALDINPAPLLCVFSPARAGANPAASAWEMRRKVRWSVPVSVEARFRTDLTFSFQGKGFWIDLSQGLVYCDLDIAGGDSVVDFSYIDLPHECVLDLEETLDCYEPMQATRTMGCVRDSIWFVCINKSPTGDHADDLVMMWTLKLPGGQWKNELKFFLRDLWRFDGFKDARLPEEGVGYPLMADDGVLYLALYGEFVGASAEILSVDHMCGFDVRNRRLLWHGTVHERAFTEAVAFPSYFFQAKHDGSRKRNFDKHHPAAELASLPLPGSKVVLI